MSCLLFWIILSDKFYDQLVFAGRGSYATFLIRHLKGRTVFRSGFAVIVNSRRRDVGMAEPLLDLREIGFMVEGIGRRRGAQGVRPNLET
jgi:hypothetical protein